MNDAPDNYDTIISPDVIISGDPPFWWGTPDDWNMVYTTPNGDIDTESP
jgi:hypothetical protein